jgi:O-antigen ligase
MVAAALLAVLSVRVAEVIPALSAIRPAILTACVSLALLAVKTRAAAWRDLWRQPQYRRVLAYIGVVIVMIPLSLWPGRSISIAQTMVLFDILLVSAVMLCAPTRRTLERLLTTFVVSTTVYALAAIRAGAVVESDRLTTLGSYDANDLAALMCVALPMACALIVRRNAGWHRIVGLACAPVLCFTITLTGSRGGLVAMIVGAVVLLGGFNPARLVPVALALTLAAPVVWNSAPETFRTRARTILALEEDYNTQSTSGRTYIWKRGVAFFVGSPLIGVGAGNFDTRLGRDFEARGTGGAWHTAHNTLIQVFVELGVLGGALFVALLVGCFRAAGRVYRARGAPVGTAAAHYPELMAGFASFCASGMFLSHGYTHLTFFLFALGGFATRVFDVELGPRRGARARRG